jgi:fused signal recognition particle receptor
LIVLKMQARSAEPNPERGSAGVFASLRRGLARTRAVLLSDLGGLLRGRQALDPALLEEIETRLLLADAGIETAGRIIEKTRAHLQSSAAESSAALIAALRATLLELLAPIARPLEVPRDPANPFVILAVGVNGSGKTTTIAKLAAQLKNDRHAPVLAAGDTFRAAAIEQLAAWGGRIGVPVVTQAHGADPAAVIHDAITLARARGHTVVLADTAGRLHTKGNLMDELKKVRRVLDRFQPAPPREIMLVLDAGTGQNALRQVREFHAAVGITGITLTKLDGTAKGGIVLALASEFDLPVRYLGVGEGQDDLQVFDAAAFVQALLADAA